MSSGQALETAFDSLVSCQSVCLVHAEGRRRGESPAAGVTDNCEPPYGFLESNSGPLQKKVLLTAKHLSSTLQHFFKISKCKDLEPYYTSSTSKDHHHQQ